MFTRIAAILRVAGEASDLASLFPQEIVRIWYIFALLEDCQLPGLLLLLPFVMQRKRGNLGFLSCIKAYQ
jgi:hypothetical protein